MRKTIVTRIWSCEALLLVMALSTSCISVKPVVVDRKTQLENQILGTFERLNDDLILASSVRNASSHPASMPFRREALQAMMNREFNRDDLDALKRAGFIGEGRDGLLVWLNEPKEDAIWNKQLVEQENRDREIVMNYIVHANAQLSENDLPSIRRIFVRLIAESAQEGDRVQREDGSWEIVKRAAPSGE